MSTWLDSAREVFAQHLATLRPGLLAGGSDPEAVASALRLQVETQLAQEGVSAADGEDIKRALARLNAVEPKVPTQPAPVPTSSTGRPRAWRVWVMGLSCGFFGVLLPLTTLGLESFTHMCAEFFDPIPTPLHLAAIALVGLANLLGLRLLFIDPVGEKNLARFAHLNAAAMGVAVFYSLWFAVLTPFAFIAVLFFGLGLLPLSPLFSLGVAGFLRFRLRRKARAGGQILPGIWLAFGIAFVGLWTLEIPGLVQAWAVQAVDSGGERQQARGLWVLRQMVSEARLLHGCYPQRDSEREAVGDWLFGRVALENRQRVYYRVTGQPYNHKPAPTRGWDFPGRQATRDTEEWVWDDGQGGGEVGQRLKALYLAQSRIDGKIDGDAALGYLEWTLVFRNDHESQQREARALVQLPPGAVVSRLTLWIDGEEREAAFGGRSQVRQAYQAVVNRRRDPVLVTAKGPDRVLVQCFPVEPHGKEMKVRLGISVPLVVAGPESARLALPRIVEQNFSAAAGLTHAVWLESPQALTSDLPVYQTEKKPNFQQALHGELSPVQFGAFSSGVLVKRDPARARGWAPNPLDPSSIVTQEFVRRPPPAGPLAIVVDGSGDLGSVAPLLAEVLDGLPATVPVRLFLAGDTVQTCPAADPQSAAAWLKAQEFTGGQDATTALQAAVAALGTSVGTVLWIHGSQPVTWQNPAALEQSLARRAGLVGLLAFSAIPGPNLLLEKLGETPDLTVLPRLGNVREDLMRTFDRLQNGTEVAVRRARPAGEKAGNEVSSHLARLWAAGEVARLLAAGPAKRDEAVALAVKMQLVTALSGAVVLESKQQYDAAGLQPVDSVTAPQTVPEAGGTLLLLAAGLGFLFLLVRRRSLSWTGAAQT